MTYPSLDLSFFIRENCLKEKP
ncbi:hypothetical protein MCO_00102, partial [Bartonella sp. DB5-6]